MKNTIPLTIEVELELLRKENLLQKQQINELSAKVEWFMEQFRLNQHKRFGISSEKTVSGQQNIFNEAELEAMPEIIEPSVEEITYKRSKKKGHREEMFKDLPVEVIEYRLPEEELECNCGCILHEMSTEVREELKFIPAQASVVRHVRIVYACRNCEKTDIKTTDKAAPMPNPPIPGSACYEHRQLPM